MQIGERTNEKHFHHENTCIMQHKRVINGSTFIFTYLGSSIGRDYKVVKIHKGDRWEHQHNLEVREYPFGEVLETDDIVYMGATMEAGVDF